MNNTKVWLLIGIAVIVSAAVFRTEPADQPAPTPIAQVPSMQEEQELLPVFSQEAVKYGSTGEDVYELQGRLKHLGFYNGKIDSVFGPDTLKSVKWFQSRFGMKVDGIVGPKVKLKLYNATKDFRPTEPKLHENDGKSAGEQEQGGAASLASGNTMGLSDNELKIMANAVYGEARGEPFEGQVAVAAVILNRVKSPTFPNTPSGVIFEPRAFTAVADGQIWLEPNEQAKKAVIQALNGWDPTGGCTYYFNPETATSPWIWTRPQVKTIGQHIFCM
ncbi:spore cortex-lytic enzyme [Paenibacillus sp. F411]|uniref:Spore cortex-lytic enzyme n=1 Tax=Paenibacillus algicola TaxID=2565926 RepID=A0A4P8XNJ7_9BACL|nr:MULTISPECIES: spore cortex-lytic enzyme [Paenibacillus]MBO2944135.1 spore cortex-lytic enzyme [Paenibacillus sp. F411]QCT03151.1 spore cortex-lytic enzyme [Paenibacillus algicola]